LYYYDYPILTNDITYTIAIANLDGTKGACLDVGMPTSVMPFIYTNPPVTSGTLSQIKQPQTQTLRVEQAQTRTLRVVINLQGNLTGTTFLAFVRSGTCGKLGPPDPQYPLENVVNGGSISILHLDNFLPSGLTVDVEKQGAALGDYVACTETGPALIVTPSSPPCTTFPETGKTVCGLFLDYWKSHGGLAQQGYPISDVFPEKSPTDGNTYKVQYFERAVFEYHPENSPPYVVLLSLLGDAFYKQKYPNGAPNQTPNTSPGSQLFPQTGHRLGGRFLTYWKNHGGLAQQGYPISDEFQEISPTDGKTYKVQYFERAVFEYHPENAPPNDVLLSLLGTFTYQQKYPNP
jgi:hypothetical protein